MSTSEETPSPVVDGQDHPQPENSQATKPLPRPSRRRDKPQLSCNLCRRRKLKCDRKQPCETCARRGLSLSCTYVNANATERPSQDRARPQAPPNIPDRIAQLETLVVTLMKNVQDGKPMDTTSLQVNNTLPKDLPSPPDHTSNDVEASPEGGSTELCKSFGRIKLTNDESSYVESAHWTAIIDGIAELKDYFGDDHDNTDENEFQLNIPAYEGPALLFGSVKPTSRQEILAAIPPKHVTDSLLAKYFGVLGLAPVVIHSPTFVKEYERFWANPQETSLMWIGLLFGILCTSATYQQLTWTESAPISQRSSSSPASRLILSFREKLVQCLVVGDYAKGGPYTIETLIFYMFIEMFQSEDTEVEVWLLIGLITRLSLKMGYHRDPSHSTLISPFNGEMRRRTWHVIHQMDVVASAQMGLPSMIREVQADTMLPRNLKDEDFDDNTVELPPSRPDTDVTHVLFLISKNKLIKVFGEIHELSTSTRRPPFDEVLRLDKLLRHTMEKLPKKLHMQSMEESIRDNLDLVIGRMYIALLFHKSLIVLHRLYLFPDDASSRYIKSRDICLDAALEILKYQSILDIETQSTGRLYNERWKISSLVKQEFLLGTTILCLYIDRDLKADASPETRRVMSDLELRDKIIKALYGSYLIWLRFTETSREAQKAARVLRLVLSKVPRVSTPPPDEIFVTDTNFLNNDQSSSSADFEALMADISSPQQPLLFDAPFMPASAANPFSLDIQSQSDMPGFMIDSYMDNWQSSYRALSREEYVEQMSISEFNFPSVHGF